MTQDTHTRFTAAQQGIERGLQAFNLAIMEAFAVALAPPAQDGEAPSVKVERDPYGGKTFTVYTDPETQRTYHVLVREGGSICFYFTVPGGSFHAVLFDTLDEGSLNPEPDWSQAPEWATAHAYLSNMQGCWFELPPFAMRREWDARGGRVVIYDADLCHPFWRGTLRHRPQDA